MCPKDTDGMAINEDPDQTASDRSSLIWVFTVNYAGIDCICLKTLDHFCNYSKEN